jgi:ribosomal protein S18 acetylase RimI-like enzyme
MHWPALGSRVSVRYRLSPGDTSATTDVIGVLEAVAPALLIHTKSDGVVEVAPDAVIAVKEIPYKPVRTSEIRALEHAAALAWPGVEQHWLDGWLLRFGHGATSRANSAVPLGFSATLGALPGIVEWYRERGLSAWLALPERVLPVRAAGVKPARVMVRDIADPAPAPADATLRSVPDAGWLTCYNRDVPLDVLTAVVDGEVTFASVAGAAVGRGAITGAPDGTRWLGISSVRVEPAARRRGHARRICQALVAWAAEHGAQRAYVQVLTDNDPAIALYMSTGFRLHHSHRYVPAEQLLGPTI